MAEGNPLFCTVGTKEMRKGQEEEGRRGKRNYRSDWLRTPVPGGAALWKDNRKVKPTPRFSVLDLQFRGQQGLHVNYFILKAKENYSDDIWSTRAWSRALYQKEAGEVFLFLSLCTSIPILGTRWVFGKTRVTGPKGKAILGSISGVSRATKWLAGRTPSQTLPDCEALSTF